MRTRTQVCERPELFIGLRASDNRGIRASNFLGSARASRVVRGALVASYPDGIRLLARRILPPIGEALERFNQTVAD